MTGDCDMSADEPVALSLADFRRNIDFYTDEALKRPVVMRVSKSLCARHSMRTCSTYATQEKEPGGRYRPAEHSL